MSRIFKLKLYIRLHDKPGMFFITLNYCMYGHRHRESSELIWKGLKLLTNAPWLAPLGVLCDRTHDHHHLMANHTTWSAAYGAKLCKDYALMHKSAPQWLKLMHCRLPITKHDKHWKRVSSLALDGHWPDIPLVCTIGDMDDARAELSFEENLVLCPLRADPEFSSQEKLDDLEGEFRMLVNWLSTLDQPASDVRFQVLGDGTERYQVVFDKEFFDLSLIHI